MLTNTLSTNEIKNAAGTGVTFDRRSISDHETEFRNTTNPALPKVLTIAHEEIGNGLKKRRRTKILFDVTSISTVDSITPVVTTIYQVIDSPIGAITSTSPIAEVLAYMNSFMASLGASTTILYDGSGNGAVIALNGTL
jgi:hypothetical protein